MRRAGLALLVAAMGAAPGWAQDAAAPVGDFSITGGGTIVSDYRFRGISRTGRRPAVQGTLGVNHASGAYVGVWASSIHDYVAAGAGAEVDLYAGYRKTIGGTTLDGGLLYYAFPGSAKASRTGFFEPYLDVSHTLGPVEFKVGARYAWKQHALACADPRCTAREDALYTYGQASSGIPGTGITITGHVGESFGRSALTAGLKDYADYGLTAAYVWRHLTFSAGYVGTDIARRQMQPAGGRHPAKDGVVFAVAAAF